MMSRSCAACHTDVYKTYARSVHGRALVEDDNQDVPACADCHTHHQVQQPGTAKFRLNSPETCIRCHGNAALMSKYGISTTVAQTYLSDFHGVTASLSRNLSETAAADGGDLQRLPRRARHRVAEAEGPARR